MDSQRGVNLDEPWSTDHEDTDSLLGENGHPLSSKARSQYEAAPEKGENGFGGTVFTIINSVVGGGVVALPFAISSVGLALGNILIALLSLVTMYSVKLMVAASMHAFGEGRSYEALAQKAIGPRLGKVLVEIFVGTFILGALTGYVNVTGATLTPLVNAIDPNSFCLNEKIVQIIVSGALMLPLSSLKSMSMFRFTGFVAFLCILFVAGAIVTEGVQAIVRKGSAIMDGIELFRLSPSAIFSTLPVVGFAFVFHSSFFPIWRSMENPSSTSVSRAGYLSLFIVAVAYAAISTFGYLAFGPNTKPNIMENYPPQDFLMVISKACYLLVVIVAFPINCFVLRSSIDRMLFKRQPAPLWRCIILAVCLVALADVLAMVLPNIQFVLGVAGAIPGAFLSFIFPPLFYILLVDNRSHAARYSVLSVNYDEQFETKYKKGCSFYFSWQKIFAWLLLLVGLAFCIVSMVNLIQNAINSPSNNNHGSGWGCSVNFAPNSSAPAPAAMPSPVAFAPVEQPT